MDRWMDRQVEGKVKGWKGEWVSIQQKNVTLPEYLLSERKEEGGAWIKATTYTEESQFNSGQF